MEENGVGVGRCQKGRHPEKDLGQGHIREEGKESHFQDRDLLLTGVKTLKLVQENRSQEVGHGQPTRIESIKVEEVQETATRAMKSSEEVGPYQDHNPGVSAVAVVQDVIGQSHEKAKVEEATQWIRKGANPALTKTHNNRSRGTLRLLHLEQAVL